MRRHTSLRRAALFAFFALAPALLQTTQAAEEPPTASAPSWVAQRVYARSTDKLVQIRILLNGVRTKSSAGSGFFVSSDGLIVTNYHVIADLALEPLRYSAEFVATDGTTGVVTLLAFDTAHDLAVVRTERKAGPFFPIAASSGKALRSGQRIFALGNPLDLGFAIAEGTFNGLIEQHFYRQILFTGALNPGMSGGPALDDEGRVIGVNVAKRRDGELTSFLVPAERVEPLLRRARTRTAGESAAAPADFKAQVTQQLIEHQDRVAQRLLAAPLPTEKLGDYLVPVAPGEWVRCWANASRNNEAYVKVDTNRCNSQSAVYVSDRLRAGHIGFNHEFGHADSGARFLRTHATGFASEPVGQRRGNALFGATRCTEDFVALAGATAANPASVQRVVVCVRAYRDHAGLYDFTVATASSDRANRGLQSRLVAHGFSYENGIRIARRFLESIQWRPA